MILTREDRIVVDELPRSIVPALEFYFQNKTAILQSKQIQMPEDYEYHIISNHQEEEFIHWQSHRKYVYCYIILYGQEIIDINDISELEPIQDYHKKSDTLLYRGVAQSRVRLKEGNIIILNPEDAYRFHYIPDVLCTKLLVKILITLE